MNNEQKLSPAPQNEVYRWVKASKRLPKKLNKDYPIRLDGEVYESGFFNRESYGTPFYSRGDRTNEMGEWEFNRIEWLERVEPQPQEQEKEETQQDRINKIYEMGVYFGYPSCCINAFIHDMVKGTDPRDRNIDGNVTGFTPCNHHVEMVKRRMVRLEDLIQSRVCSKPFPEHNESDLMYKQKPTLVDNLQEQEKDFGSQQHSLDCNSVATLRSSSCNSIRHSENIGG
jgi:hypothetical protein